MKRAFLFHGTGGSDKDYFWFGDTKKFLEDHGYKVWWPQMPNTEKPTLTETRNFIEQNMPAFDEQTIIIGHSSACPLILHLMQYFKIKVKQVVLVSGYYEPQPDGVSSMLPEKFEWNIIKNKAENIILINSDNDPWSCHDQQARQPAIKLGAVLIVNTGQGHMGSNSFDQPYRNFKLLKDNLAVE